MSLEAWTQAGLNLIQQAMSIFDNDLKLVFANRRMQQLFELPAELTLPGTDFGAIIHCIASRGEYGDLSDIETFVRERESLARTFEPHYFERVRPNGQTISIEGAPLPQGGWVAVYTDITEIRAQERLLRTRSESLSEEVLRRSEELAATNRQLAAANLALAETQSQLAEIEARTRTTTEMVPAHIARVDAEGRYTFSNNQLPVVLPDRPQRIIDQHMSDVLGASAWRKVGPRFAEALKGKSSTFEFSDETSSRRIRVALTPDPLEPGVYVLSQDITEETQTRAALQQTRRREIAAHLTSGMAHDFSNLLTIILGLQSRLQRCDLDEDAGKLVTGTMQAARRGGALLDRIADITGPRTWRPKRVDMAAFLTDLATLAQSTLPAGVSLEIGDWAGEDVMIDAGMVQDSVLNLVLNARDACGGSGHISIEVIEVKSIWLQITVRDSGPGFSDDALQRALHPFFTTKEDDGSGLGLAMVYDMTKLAGGSVRLHNRASPSGIDGASVTLRLPLRRAQPVDSGGMILLVEDQAEIRETVRQMLIELGHSVVEATSVEEARQLVQDLPDIVLVLSDILLEGDETGLDLARGLTSPPVRLMTSLLASDPRHREATAHGPVLSKPFDIDMLAWHLGLTRDKARA